MGEKVKEEFYIASDHGAFEAKSNIISYLNSTHKNLEVIDLGTGSEESCNYAEYALKLAKKVQQKDARAILLCGSGIGASLAANRVSKVRATLCRSVEDARLSRQHNNSNVLTLGGRVTPFDQMKEMIDVWLKEDFEGGRHIERISVFDELGEK